MQLGSLGVWYPLDRLDRWEICEFLSAIKRSGYDTLWYPEARGYESFSLAAFLLDNSKRLRIGSSIASIYARDAFTAQRGLATLSKLHGDRFILGLGVSHVPIVEGMRGHSYEKPVPAMRGYLDAMAKARAPGEDHPVMIAALGPRMLKLAGERTRGALPYNVTPRHTAEAREALGPDKWLAVEQKVLLETDPAKARAIARETLGHYMRLDNYRKNWLRIGFTEEDFANGGSDRFVDAMVLWGDADRIRRGLRQHFEAGATHVCLQPVHVEGDFHARDHMLEALADT
jgi:probable F420-dependent oxidoreductase